MNMPISTTIFYIGSMIFIGFLEEIIFRGFLFNAMRKDGEKTAIIVSSITFGFLFVVIFVKGKSLIPCIITHSLIDMTSAFCNQEFASNYLIPVSIVTGLFCLLYSVYLLNENKEY
ncbi:MAG: CPBP family intramembrane metalloprotease [Clostridia bacterium]|nr:CPBP family intramembrane metalloprotease [Clostridia bacterium]